jgi:hypothetical protein
LADRAPTGGLHAAKCRAELSLGCLHLIVNLLPILIDEIARDVAVVIDDSHGLADDDTDYAGLQAFRQTAGDLQQGGVRMAEFQPYHQCRVHDWSSLTFCTVAA